MLATEESWERPPFSATPTVIRPTIPTLPSLWKTAEEGKLMEDQEEEGKKE